ncbi:hypothetical protein [Gaopeijia maritima]|uniref:Lipoprotein n=1 Tax=Gaopeijia maritima TaxID=3119007 RepID=A0ABU9ECK6_9BACT
MIRRAAAWLPALALLLAACSGGAPPAPPEPPPLDPTGVYDISVDAQGQMIPGTLSIEGSAEEGYTGSVDSQMGGAPISDITVEGQRVTFSVPDFGVQGSVVFEGSGFSGNISGAMGAARIVGTRR